MSLCRFPTFAFSFALPNLLPSLPTLDLGFTLALPLPPYCPLD